MFRSRSIFAVTCCLLVGEPLFTSRCKELLSARQGRSNSQGLTVNGPQPPPSHCMATMYAKTEMTVFFVLRALGLVLQGWYHEAGETVLVDDMEELRMKSLEDILEQWAIC